MIIGVFSYINMFKCFLNAKFTKFCWFTVVWEKQCTFCHFFQNLLLFRHILFHLLWHLHKLFCLLLSGWMMILMGLTSTCVPWSLNMLCSPILIIQALGSSVRNSAHGNFLKVRLNELQQLLGRVTDMHEMGKLNLSLFEPFFHPIFWKTPVSHFWYFSCSNQKVEMSVNTVSSSVSLLTWWLTLVNQRAWITRSLG